MKKLLILALVVALVGSFAFTAASQGGGYPWNDKCDGHECYFDQGCAYDPDTGLYYCWYLKCCRDEYMYKGACVWSDYFCVSVI